MDINMVLEENERLKQRISELEDKLKNYSNPPAHQAFYEKNKGKIIKESNIHKWDISCENHKDFGYPKPIIDYSEQREKSIKMYKDSL